MASEPVKKIPEWNTKTISYWGSPSGATYKVIKCGMLWDAYKYSNSKWHKIFTGESKLEAQEKCELHGTD